MFLLMYRIIEMNEFTEEQEIQIAEWLQEVAKRAFEHGWHLAMITVERPDLADNPPKFEDKDNTDANTDTDEPLEFRGDENEDTDDNISQ
jgi:hypothetical protein